MAESDWKYVWKITDNAIERGRSHLSLSTSAMERFLRDVDKLMDINEKLAAELREIKRAYQVLRGAADMPEVDHDA